MTEQQLLPPDPDPLAGEPGPDAADDGLPADAPEHDAESVSPGGEAMPDDGPDAEEHAVDDPDLGGEG